jgi:hypothetical protein
LPASPKTGRILSIPNIPFIELHMILAEQITVLLFKRVFMVMLLLAVYVANQILKLTPSDGEIAIASLPEKIEA